MAIGNSESQPFEIPQKLKSMTGSGTKVVVDNRCQNVDITFSEDLQAFNHTINIIISPKT